MNWACEEGGGGGCQEPTRGDPRDSIQLPCGPPASGPEDVIIQDEVFGPAEETPPHNFSKVFDQNPCNKKWHCIILHYLDSVNGTVSGDI